MSIDSAFLCIPLSSFLCLSNRDSRVCRTCVKMICQCQEDLSYPFSVSKTCQCHEACQCPLTAAVAGEGGGGDPTVAGGAVGEVFLLLHVARDIVVVHTLLVLPVELLAALTVEQLAHVVLAAPVGGALLVVVVVGLVTIGDLTHVFLRVVCHRQKNSLTTHPLLRWLYGR